MARVCEESTGAARRKGSKKERDSLDSQNGNGPTHRAGREANLRHSRVPFLRDCGWDQAGFVWPGRRDWTATSRSLFKPDSPVLLNRQTVRKMGKGQSLLGGSRDRGRSVPRWHSPRSAIRRVYVTNAFERCSRRENSTPPSWGMGCRRRRYRPCCR